MRRLFSFIGSLADMPELGAPVDETSDARQISFRDYNVYYRIHSDRIEILRVLHHRRNAQAELMNAR